MTSSESRERHSSGALAALMLIATLLGVTASILAGRELGSGFAATALASTLAVLAYAAKRAVSMSLRAAGHASNSTRAISNAVALIVTLVALRLAGVGAGAAGVVVAGLLVLHGAALFGSRDPRRPSLGLAMLVLLAAALEANLALLASGGWLGLALFAGALGTALIGAVEIDGRRALVAARRRLGPERSPSPFDARRWRFAVGLAFACLLTTPLVLTFVRNLLPQLNSRTPLATELDTGAASQTPESEREQAPSASDPSASTVQDVFPSSLDYSGDGPQPNESIAVEVRARRGLLPDQLYLVGARFTDLTDAALVAPEGVERVLMDRSSDGELDGWIQVAAGAPLGDDANAREFEVRHAEVRLGRESLLYRPTSTGAISIEPVVDGIARSAAQPRLTIGASGSWTVPHSTSSGVRSSQALRTRFLARLTTRVGESPTALERAALLELPSAVTEHPGFRARAAAVLGDATSVSAKLDAIAQHFRDDYRYTLEGGAELGLANLLGFFERREGFCTHFAGAAMLLLREASVPARVVGGYVAQEVDTDPETGELRLIARERNAHAWVEAFDSARGWITFDPTPADLIANAVREHEGSLDRRLAKNEFDAALEGFRNDPAAGLGDLIWASARYAGVRLGNVGRIAVGLALLVAVASLLNALKKRGAPRAARDAVQLAAVDPSAPGHLRARMVRALRRLLPQSREAWTLRELGQESLAADGFNELDVPRPEFRSALELADRERFAEGELPSERRTQLEELVEGIERGVDALLASRARAR